VVQVTLPIDPKWQTLSEVATLEWVRKMTHLPVLKVLAYGADRANPTGFEYIVMEKMRGQPLADVWHDIHFDAKESLPPSSLHSAPRPFSSKRIGSEISFPTQGGIRDVLKLAESFQQFSYGMIISIKMYEGPGQKSCPFSGYTH